MSASYISPGCSVHKHSFVDLMVSVVETDGAAQLLPNYCRGLKLISLQDCMCQCFVQPHFYQDFDLYVNETRPQKYGGDGGREDLAAQTQIMHS